MLTFTPLASSSSGNCYILTDGRTDIMIDCGIPWTKIKQLMSYKTSSLSCILCSHAHDDHSHAVKDATKAGIDIYMLSETKEALGVNSHRIHKITLEATFQIGTFKIMAFPLQHKGNDGEICPNCGFLIVNKQGERFVYITDTCYCKYFFPSLNILAIECNYQKEILNKNVKEGTVPAAMKNRLLWSHFSLENVIKLLKANDLSRLKSIHLMHLSEGNSNERKMKRAVQAATGKPVYICPE